MAGPLQPGAVLGRDFEIVRHLADGNMGAVYLALQRSTGKERALKVMSAELAANEKARERFVLEAKVGAKIDSDHVVEVVTAGIDEETGVPYLVMELLKGEELHDKIRREGWLPLAQVAEIIDQAGHALGKAHALGIVHRDIKPQNLFIAEPRRQGVPFTVKILDFGIAKLVAERTQEGTQAIGTPLFMAPEQTERGGHVTPAADVWPLGLIAYYALTGNLYWLSWEEGVTTLLREVVLEPLVPASERAAAQGAPELPAWFDGWFARCVTRDLTERFSDASEAARAFAALARGGTSDAAVAATVAATVDASLVGETLLAPEVTEKVARTGAVAAGTKTQAGAVAAGTKTQAGAVAAGTSPQPSAAKIGGGTDLEASKSLIEPAAKEPSKSRAPLIVAVLAAAGAAGFFLLRGGEKIPTASPTASRRATPTATATTTPTSTAAATAAATTTKGCPPGMALIAGGKGFVGSKDEDLPNDVQPPHRVTLHPFCLDKTEVTVAAYEACTASGDCARAPTSVQFEGLDPSDKAAKAAYSSLCNAGHADRVKHPINCVDWNMAANFCQVRGGRLPTEAEWELAARGSRQKSFPWGDEKPGPKLLNAADKEYAEWMKAHDLKAPELMFAESDGYAGTAPVGSFPDGATAEGVVDLAGNVWEWTADWYGPYRADPQSDPKGPASGDKRVVRGGGFNGSRPAWAKPAFRFRARPGDQSHGIGFRCAADPK